MDLQNLKKFKNKYINIQTRKKIFQSQNKDYVNRFIKMKKRKFKNNRIT